MAQVIEGDFNTVDHVGQAKHETLSIACLNLSPTPGDVAGNLMMAERAIRETVRESSSVAWIVLPELITCGYSDLENVHRYAEDAQSGVSARFFAGLARDLDLHIAYGFPESVPGTETGVYDSANLVGPEGVAATYRKRNLVRTTAEYKVFTAGTELPVVEARGIRVALAVCWDLGFPEFSREAAMSGADLILAPAAWRSPWKSQYDLSCAARALDSGVYVASANQLGDYPEAQFDAPGHVHGPDGERISQSVGVTSIGILEPEAPARWRAIYGNTIIGDDNLTVISGDAYSNDASAVSSS